MSLEAGFAVCPLHRKGKCDLVGLNVSSRHMPSDTVAWNKQIEPFAPSCRSAMIHSFGGGGRAPPRQKKKTRNPRSRLAFFSTKTSCFLPFWGFIQSKTRVLDRINFFSLQNKAFWPCLEFILSKTRVLDRINFFSL